MSDNLHHRPADAAAVAVAAELPRFLAGRTAANGKAPGSLLSPGMPLSAGPDGDLGRLVGLARDLIDAPAARTAPLPSA